MNYDLIYIYCISNSPSVLSDKLKSAGIQSLAVESFYVFLKYVPESEYSEDNFKLNLSNMPWLETNAREHVDVISMLMEQNTMIPFKFGTIFLTQESLRKFVADYSDSLTENFQHIKNMEEWSVKIYCDRKVLCEKIDELSNEAAALEKQIMESSPGKAYLLKRKKTDLIENEMDRLCHKYGQNYFNEFENLSESTSLNNLLPKDFTGREDTMILNAVFLVHTKNVTGFNNTTENISKQDGSFGFNIEITGPWPPFSFISIKEK
jgi:hypothetical protein